MTVSALVSSLVAESVTLLDGCVESRTLKVPELPPSVSVEGDDVKTSPTDSSSLTVKSTSASMSS